MKVVITAMPEEHKKLELLFNNNPDILLVCTGIGKLNMAISLYKILSLYKGVNEVINIGVAGSLGGFNIGDVVTPGIIIPHDQYVPFEGYEYFMNSFKVSDNKNVCLTGDQFITDTAILKEKYPSNSVIDMEAYSVAKVCDDFCIKCTIIKGVSDGCNEQSLNFMDNLELAMNNSIDYLKKYLSI